jgi:hypothetical protein
MSATDKANDKSEELSAKGRKAVGEAGGTKSLKRAEGRRGQSQCGAGPQESQDAVMY